jgi:hypothetical protein
MPVTVVVGSGSDSKTFYIHEGIAKLHSDYFVAALRNGWSEAQSRVVTLEDDSPEAFGIFASFVYTGRTALVRDGDIGNGESSTDLVDEELDRIKNVWHLADKLGSTPLKDAISDAMIEKVKAESENFSYFTTSSAQFGLASNGMRRLLVDMAVWEWNEETMSNPSVGGWDGFFHDVANRQHAISKQSCKGRAPYLSATCEYHDHVAEKKPCYKKMFP